MAPTYQRIADTLRNEIRTGLYAPGEQLPTGDVLMERFDVRPEPVRQAIDLLECEGLIEHRRAVGTYVSSPRSRVTEAERSKNDATGYDTGLEVHDIERPARYDAINAPVDLAAVFDVSEGTTLLRRTYRTRERGMDAPLQMVRSYLIYDLAAANPALLDPDNEPWPGGTQHQLHTIGIELDRIIDHITARPPLPDEAEDLDTDPGVSLLVFRKISIDTYDRVVELSDILMPGDRAEAVYTTRLARW
jgi:GntR family transcriptional regulator